MSRFAISAALLASSALALGLAGCNSSATDVGSSPPAGQATAGSGDHIDSASGDVGPSAMEKMKTELAKLSPEDAASAEQQHMCPVSGEMLGAMGPPVKVDVNGQQVWICCDSCKDKLMANPAEYLAKLPKK